MEALSAAIMKYCSLQLASISLVSNHNYKYPVRMELAFQPRELLRDPVDKGSRKWRSLKLSW
jgi:hypothetical protein